MLHLRIHRINPVIRTVSARRPLGDDQTHFPAVAIIPKTAATMNNEKCAAPVETTTTARPPLALDVLFV
jgi:hypothetical protein